MLLALLLKAVHFNSNLSVSWKASKSSKAGLASSRDQYISCHWASSQQNTLQPVSLIFYFCLIPRIYYILNHRKIWLFTADDWGKNKISWFAYFPKNTTVTRLVGSHLSKYCKPRCGAEHSQTQGNYSYFSDAHKMESARVCHFLSSILLSLSRLSFLTSATLREKRNGGVWGQWEAACYMLQVRTLCWWGKPGLAHWLHWTRRYP